MERINVRSSNISSIGFDDSSEVLEVSFKGGGVYEYSGVPKSVFEGLQSAQSVGKMLNAVVKGRYPYKRVS